MLEDIRNERIKKLELLRAAGVDPYPARVRRTTEIAAVLKDFLKLVKTKKKVAVVGRAIGYRDQGNIIFLDVRDSSGAMQVILGKAHLQNFPALKKALDRGDFVAASGPVIKTKRGEKSVEAREAAIISKSLLPLPTEHFGIEDPEIRLRKRYLDLILNEDVREMFKKKSAFWSACREFMASAGFMEVETPVLEFLPGGAEAEPFKTHHNALDEDFFLRISLELPLKRLLIGGYDKIFEIGRIFRNEGIDREHLQDYTQLEFYWAYSDYNDLMKFLEKMYKFVVRRVVGAKMISEYQGKKITWGGKWGKVDYVKAFAKMNGINPLDATRDELYAFAKKSNFEVEPNAGKGRLIDLIFKRTVRPTLVQPCFLVDPPVEIEPLAKRAPYDPRRVERLQIMAGGTELGKGFSELNDPLDQRGRFEEQMKLREAGDVEAQHLDEDFLEAMEYGMPPASGFGMSERLFAVLMDRPIRETVFFPLMRGKHKE